MMTEATDLKRTEFGKPRQLYRAVSFEDIPKGAIPISQNELLTIMRRRIDKHENKLQIWPLAFNHVVTGSTGFMSALLINHHYRKVFSLKNLSLGHTYGMTGFIGAVVPYALHSTLVTEPILKGYNSCSLCLGTRGGTLQIIGGVLYPIIISSLLCIIHARNHYTYSVPSITQGSLLFKMIKTTFPFGATLSVLLFSNFLVGLLLTEKEMDIYEQVFGHSFDGQTEEGEFVTDLKK